MYLKAGPIDDLNQNPLLLINRTIYPQDPWGSLPGSEIFLVSYDNNTQVKLLQQSIKASRGIILSYIPHNTFVVFGQYLRIAPVVAAQGVQWARYVTALKIAPELLPLFSPTNTSNQDDSLFAPFGKQQGDLLLDGMATLKPSSLGSTNGVRTMPGGFGLAAPQDGGGADPSGTANVNAEVEDEEAVQYGVMVEMVALQSLTSDHVRAAARDWPAAMAAYLKRGYNRSDVCWPVMAPMGRDSNILSVFLCKKDLSGGVIWLSSQPVTQMVYGMLRSESMNLASSMLLQTGQLNDSQYEMAFNSLSRPYWDAGLQGQGEIVGVGDTGVDVEHCYLQDPEHIGEYGARLSDPSAALTFNNMSYWRIPGHRKIVQYAFNPDTGDVNDLAGHGTLCAASVAGAVLADPADPNSPMLPGLATGTAPAARLSVVDFQLNSRSGSVLSVPERLDTEYLPVHVAAGATITSDSWGSYLAGYNTKSKAFDAFLWKNPDFISLLAAGNYGMRTYEKYTIASPALAKNVVAVGAGYRVPESLGLVSGVYGITALEMVAALPPYACSPLNTTAVSGRIVLVLAGGGCSFYDMATNVLAARGAAMVITQNTLAAPYPPVPITEEYEVVELPLPMSMIYKDLGTNLVDFVLNKGGKLYVTGKLMKVDSDTVAAFSAWGPTLDGRIKPDIIAPGKDIISAVLSSDYPENSDCEYGKYGGTSAAVALAAGTVALMRQYFRSGFYPAGSNTSNLTTPFAPSGMLLKALMIAGAKNLEGSLAMAKAALLGPAPDGVQGWGRLSMAGSLPLEGFTDPRVRLQLLDRGEFSQTGQSVAASGLSATGTGPISIVLTYYDYPADTNAFIALVNNLDLLVYVNGQAYLGNNDQDAANPVADSVNTVERVLLKSPPAGASVRVMVVASNLPSLIFDPTTPQRWAVAVVGHFTGNLQSELNPFWAKWRGKAAVPLTFLPIATILAAIASGPNVDRFNPPSTTTITTHTTATGPPVVAAVPITTIPFSTLSATAFPATSSTAAIGIMVLSAATRTSDASPATNPTSSPIAPSTTATATAITFNSATTTAAATFPRTHSTTTCPPFAAATRTAASAAKPASGAPKSVPTRQAAVKTCIIIASTTAQAPAVVAILIITVTKSPLRPRELQGRCHR
ncbi:hypothetical protein VOLCADRAFT_88676 [Volvox carteri f. nagariensis]|uniref:Uncharacterized protein n=1 Tax=Volvox carteri f. nagariensis TaxID=3068 RepID=D8TPN1_VOLCA|nr:uncharacterized protein VOLCADRAFT_88676 [Volvox carteri f. nagariensis]EFJ50793.1 hypothetical protein VOLCADRAFT_88676 [Volvox carteri f. nagariensis]|eukprot:XP_002948386.1 hypothetical protein VOLCADRAFT_88676 [Volvox carteri f. nagariensis]